MQGRLRKRLILSVSAILLTAVLFFLLRGPYLSNSIKRVIIPVLENATKERIIIDKAVINLLPFYIQIKGLKMFDRNGDRLLWITKARAYIDLTGMLSRELIIRKLTIKEPDLLTDEASLKRIIENMKKTVSGEGNRKSKVSFRNIELTDGKFNLENINGMTFSGKVSFLK